MSRHMYFVVRTATLIPPTDVHKHELSACNDRELQKVTEALRLRTQSTKTFVYMVPFLMYFVERALCLESKAKGVCMAPAFREDARTLFVFNA